MRKAIALISIAASAMPFSAIAGHDKDTTRAAIGGGLGGAAGTAFGNEVGGSTGAILGGALGGAGGAAIATDGDDGHHGHRRHGRGFCPPGQARKSAC